MAELKGGAGGALSEARALVLGALLLFGFQFRAVFEAGYEALPVWSQAMKLAALGLMLLAVGLLVAPTAYYRIVERGEGTAELRGFASRVMFWALLPFALAVTLDLFVAGAPILGTKWAVAFGFLVFAAAFFFWYLLGFHHRRAVASAAAPVRGPESIVPSTVVTIMTTGEAQAEESLPGESLPGESLPGEPLPGESPPGETMPAAGSQPAAAGAAAVGARLDESSDAPKVEAGDEREVKGMMSGTSDGDNVAREVGGAGLTGGAGRAHDGVEQVLTDARTLLPGAQAFLGFQLIAALAEGFGQLPAAAQYVHLLSLLLMALTVVLLMTPAAYHRIVERGGGGEHFHGFASRFVVAALVPLALGLSGDVYVVVRKVTDSQVLSIVSALFALAMFWELWFGLTLYRRTQRRFTD
jgi:hypothetical protein